MHFDWDESKAQANLAKHGITFDEAKSVFTDPFYVDFMILIIQMRKSAISSSDNHSAKEYWWYPIRNGSSKRV